MKKNVVKIVDKIFKPRKRIPCMKIYGKGKLGSDSGEINGLRQGLEQTEESDQCQLGAGQRASRYREWCDPSC